MPARTLDGRLLCATECAYEIENPYFEGVGYLKHGVVTRISQGVNSCLVGRTIDGIVVAFRGTQPDSLLDWLQNAALYLRKVDELPGRIHSGFYEAATALYEQTKACVLELIKESRHWYTRRPKIYLTGHSKGGCLASLTAMFMAQDNEIPKAEYVCTFGAARVGDPDFETIYDRFVNQVSYENYLDVVPFLPPGDGAVRAMSKNMLTKINDILWSKQERHRAKDYFWNYCPCGRRYYIDENREIIKDVTKELDHQRIKDIESKTLLSPHDFRRAHCPNCPDDHSSKKKRSNQSSDHTIENKSKCSGGYFCAVAPEICGR